MLNFQIRGNQINISICEISTINLTETLDEIRTHKKSLAEVVLNKGIDSFQIHYNMTKPILNDNSELIVSSFDINNYYDEGHSFYRNKLIDLTQNPYEKPLKFPNSKNVLINISVYYGCAFEAELDDMDYKSFDENLLSIPTSVDSILNNIKVDCVFWENQELQNLNRNKNEMVAFRSVLCEKKEFSREHEQLASPNKDYEKVIDAQINMRSNK